MQAAVLCNKTKPEKRMGTGHLVDLFAAVATGNVANDDTMTPVSYTRHRWTVAEGHKGTDTTA